ncbi:DnaB-like helicase C-terminal domain-containing protein [Streptomyces asiaticus]|uniref:DnaB-like helicase C-terminal domain-containing protein n=1 Tax=Streptomyces asiaticus TaxID=114695 RepID=UPI003F67B61F
MTDLWDAPADETEGRLARPQDLPAERIVLGSIMQRPDLIDELADVVDPVDFTFDQHAWVWYAIDELRTEMVVPAGGISPFAIDAKLQAWRASGRMPCVPLDAIRLSMLYEEGAGQAAEHFAARVASLAEANRFIDLGMRATQLGMSANFDRDTALADAQAALDAVVRDTEHSVPTRISDLVPAVFKRAVTPPDLSNRVPTGIRDLDDLTGGFAPRKLIIVGARPGVGKALALDTPLATPTGWTTMGEVRVGDYVMGADGKPARVSFATEVQHDRECFEVEFSDGSVIVADAEHLWFTDTRASLKSAQAAAVGYNRMKNQRTFPAVRTTAEIAATLRCDTKEQRLNHSVVNAKPLELPDAELPVDPYVLGVWLGDGATATARISTADPEILDALRMAGHQVNKTAGDNYDYGVLGLQTHLRAIGVLGNKHIPEQYLRASEAQRRALLAGLLDTDGTVRQDGLIQFAVTKKRLAEDARELISTLGYRTGLSRKVVRGRTMESSTCYTLSFSTADKVFRLPRKLARQKTQHHPHARRRFITDVRPVPSVPVRCIQVDNEDRMYLAGRTCIPTHNTTLANTFVRASAIDKQIPTLFVSLEMGEEELGLCICAAEATVPLHNLDKGQCGPAEVRKLEQVRERLEQAPLYIDDTPHVTLAHLRNRIRTLIRTVGLRYVVLDYLQLAQAPKAENRQVAVSQLSRNLKLMAKEFDIPIVVLAQLNRGNEQRTDKRPVIADLRESGSIEQDADIVILLHRPDMYEPESARAGECDLIVDKHRGGKRTTLTVAAQMHYARLVDMAVDFNREAA